ncbi:MAG: hypothetical protein ACTSWE_14550 [Promethearchaeota archaeon]
MEERIINEILASPNRPRNNSNAHEKESTKKQKSLIFEKIITLINKFNSSMLGPEKTTTARFISEHYTDVYEILKEYK